MSILVPRFVLPASLIPASLRHHTWLKRWIADAAASVDLAVWRAHAHVDKYLGDVDEYRARFGKEEGELRFGREAPLVGIADASFNLLTTNGANILWTALIGGAITAFNNANAQIGVGDSTSAANVGQTDLQSATNKLRKPMDATFPTVATNQVTFKSTFGTGDANFAWNETGIFNSGTGGTMLNRLVSGLGSKTAAASWGFTLNITLS